MMQKIENVHEGISNQNELVYAQGFIFYYHAETSNKPELGRNYLDLNGLF